MTYLQNLVKDLMETYPTLTEYQAVKLATEIIRNDILIKAFGVHSDSNSSSDHPAFLEGIAMALGYKSYLERV